MIEVRPVTLEGRWVRLEPLQLEHAHELTPQALDEEVWRYLPAPWQSEADVEAWIRAALANQEAGREVPFLTRDLRTGTAAGSTRYMDIRPEHDGLEIGFTWLGRQWWRTVVNSESKYLLLRHAFEELRCMRVTLKTDLLNVRSQRGIERLGAVREGVLRKHMIVQEGRARDSVYYSIIDDEWPHIKARMETELYAGL